MAPSSFLTIPSQFAHRFIGSLFGQQRRFHRFTYPLSPTTQLITEQPKVEIVSVVSRSDEGIDVLPAIITRTPLRIRHKIRRGGGGNRRKRQRYNSTVLGFAEAF